MLPEPPKPLPPTDLHDTLAPSVPNCALSVNFEPHTPSLPPGLDTDDSGPITVRTRLVTRIRQIYQTQPNSFGLFRCYDKENLPACDPEDISDDIAGSQPAAQRFVTTPQVSDAENMFHPYPNEASLQLGDWYWNRGDLKSKESFKQLLDIIRSPSFSPDDVRNTKWASIDHALGTLETGDGSAGSEEWLHGDAGWKCKSVAICVPFS